MKDYAHCEGLDNPYPYELFSHRWYRIHGYEMTSQGRCWASLIIGKYPKLWTPHTRTKKRSKKGSLCTESPCRLWNHKKSHAEKMNSWDWVLERDKTSTSLLFYDIEWILIEERIPMFFRDASYTIHRTNIAICDELSEYFSWVCFFILFNRLD